MPSTVVIFVGVGSATAGRGANAQAAPNMTPAMARVFRRMGGVSWRRYRERVSLRMLSSDGRCASSSRAKGPHVAPLTPGHALGYADSDDGRRRRGQMGKRWKLSLLALTAIVAANGCSSMNHTEKDAIGGGVIGAGVGALLDRRHPGQGAAIGGAVGAVAGAAVGHAEDNAERRDRAIQAAASAPVRGPLKPDEIVTMAKSGVSDATIINQI